MFFSFDNEPLITREYTVLYIVALSSTKAYIENETNELETIPD